MDFKKRVLAELKTLFNTVDETLSKTWTKDELDIKSEAVGGKVEVINTDGTLSPAPDGDYAMDNGNTFTLKDGVITVWNGETEKPVEEEAELAEPETEEAPEEPKDDSNEKLEALQSEVEALKASIEEIKSAIGNFSSKEDITAFSNKLEALTSTLKEYMSVPVEAPKTATSFTIKKTQEQKFNGLSQALAELKNQ